MKKYRIKVFGRVQGIFLRAQTKKLAQELNLSGYVKNETDGSVRIEAKGDEENIKKLIAWAKVGPKGAQIESIKIEEIEADPDSVGFEIRY